MGKEKLMNTQAFHKTRYALVVLVTVALLAGLDGQTIAVSAAPPAAIAGGEDDGPRVAALATWPPDPLVRGCGFKLKCHPGPWWPPVTP